jgi:hypothetical protein
MAEQPAMRWISHRVSGGLPNARAIHRNAFFFGNHHEVGLQERAAVVDYFRDFMAKEGL